MMRAQLTIVMCAFLAAVVSVSFLRHRRPHPPPSFIGTVLDVSATDIVMLLHPRSPGDRPFEVRLALGSRTTKVVRCEIDVGPARLEAARLADLRSGQVLAVSAKGDAATELKILPPAPVTGHIVSSGPRKLTIRVDAPAGKSNATVRTFAIDPFRTKIMASSAEAAPRHIANESTLRPNRSVRVYASDHVAQAIQVLPPPQVVGILVAMSGSGITISPHDNLGQSTGEEQTVAADFSRMEAFHKYFGVPIERAATSELKVGDEVAVSVEDGRAIAVTIIHPPIYATISSIHGGSFTIKASARSPLPVGTPREFRIEPGHTRIFFQRFDHNFITPQGKSGRAFRYVPGPATGLMVGQQVSITAREDVVISMRVRPAEVSAMRGIILRRVSIPPTTNSKSQTAKNRLHFPQINILT